MAYKFPTEVAIRQISGSAELLARATDDASKVEDIGFSVDSYNSMVRTGLGRISQNRLIIVLESFLPEIKQRYLERCENDVKNATVAILQNIPQEEGLRRTDDENS